ncbi:MAG: small multi-drug export protein [Tissierellia bacterium]|nr:small multi-drug export protein [Tissierellia bacterium]
MQPLLNFLSIELTVLLTAALPIIELRGAIPVGISLGLSPIHATLISLVGSMIPVPFILFSIRPIFNYLKKTKLFKKLVHKLTDKSLNKSGKIQKYGAWGLLVFVAIPLPGTGVWSGSLAAALLDMRFKWAFPAILVGNIIAAVIIMGLSNEAFKLFG